MRAYRLAYDGRPYSGFQRQPDVPTVEGELLAALERLGVGREGEVPPGYAAAGRTDAGVSALAQTVTFEGPEWLTPAALNSQLPDTVRAWASADVPETFHATHDATERAYIYYLHAPEADDALASDTLAALSGEHDYHNLTPDDDGTVRTLDASGTREGEFLVVELRASGFARQLVRRVVGLLAEVLRGEAPPSKVERVLSPEPMPGPDGVAPAPAYPLVLSEVRYPGVAVERDTDAVAGAIELFASRRAEHRTNARVAGHIRDGIE